MVTKLEFQLYKQFPDTKSYQTKARSLIFNLKDKKNVWLKESLYSGVLEPQRAVILEANELASEAKKQERESTIKNDL